MKRTVSLLLAMLMLLSFPCVLADETATVEESPLIGIAPFEFRIYEDGIDYAECPVYSAPSENAYRAHNYEAVCDTDAKIAVAGYVNEWLLVRYQKNDGGYRVGYIPPDYVSGFETPIDTDSFVHVKQIAGADIVVTDDPVEESETMVVLSAGEPYTVIGKYKTYGNWWYIECKVNGDVARGFIKRDAEGVDPGYDIPAVSPKGEAAIGTIVITKQNWLLRQRPGTDYDVLATLFEGEQYTVYSEKTDANTNIHWLEIYVDGIWGWVAASGGTLTLN